MRNPAANDRLAKRAMAHAERVASADERNQVTALARGMTILQCFTTTRRQLGSTELARLTALPQPTVWRLCQTLVQAGFLMAAPGSQRFQLGASVLALGFAASAAFDVLETVRPRMQALADRHQASFSVAGREGLDMVYLQRCAAEAMLGMNLQRGSRIPIVKTTLGWAYIAALEPDARSRLLGDIRRADAEHWPDVERQVAPALRDYERKGFLLRRGLTHPDVISLAVPIASSATSQVLAINCSGHRGDLTADTLENDIAPQLKELAGVIAASLSATASGGRRGERAG
jgi:DNA-binding IclR family transcriptional regulator